MNKKYYYNRIWWTVYTAYKLVLFGSKSYLRQANTNLLLHFPDSLSFLKLVLNPSIIRLSLLTSQGKEYIKRYRTIDTIRYQSYIYFLNDSILYIRKPNELIFVGKKIYFSLINAKLSRKNAIHS